MMIAGRWGVVGFVLLMAMVPVVANELAEPPSSDPPPKTIEAFKERLKELLLAEDGDALRALYQDDQVPEQFREHMLAGLPRFDMEDASMTISIVPYYANSLPPRLEGRGGKTRFLIHTITPDLYCLVESRRDDWRFTFELGLCERTDGIYICGQKFFEYEDDMTLPAFELVATGPPDAFTTSDAGEGWGTQQGGYRFQGFSMDRFARFLSHWLGIEITNATSLAGTYEFYAPIGDVNSISRTLVGLREMGLDLREVKDP